ncbi:hypothetical protein BH09ACT12_BH09ACT12_11220 [soil metagenome]
MTQTTAPTAITAVRDAKAARAAAEVVELQAVVAWSVEYRVDKSIVDDLTFGVDGILLGGLGCPLVSEFDVYDLAAGLGMSSEAGCGYVAKVLELRYRLRKIWEQVIALKVPVWKAFRVAEQTMNLNFDHGRACEGVIIGG